MGVRDALEMATIGGARVLGRDDDIGSIEVGKVADLALWRVDTLRHVDIADPVAALTLGAPPPLELLLVDGRAVVERDVLVTVDEHAVARDVAAAHRTLRDRAERVGVPGMTTPTSVRQNEATGVSGGIGTNAERPDGTLKVTGEFAYASDLWMDNMLWGSTLRSPHAYARIKSLNIGPGAGAAGRLRGPHGRRRARRGPVRPGDRRPAGPRPDVVRYQGEPVVGRRGGPSGDRPSARAPWSSWSTTCWSR
jgi:hypothetical protein